MKKFSKILMSLILLLSFTTSVSAASYSNSISAYTNGTKYEYINGLPVYYTTASGYNLYVLNSGTYFGSTTYLSDPILADNGFTYIVNNSNVTNNSSKNYYIAQVAILWYQDYLNGNDTNISSSLKNYISSHTSGDTVCYYINKLVNNAKNSSNLNSIKFVTTDVTFTRNGNYYYSNTIDVETNNLGSTPSVRLYNAPSSASIIDNTVRANGSGSFRISIPSSSLNSYTRTDFEVYITGNDYNYSVYKYSNYGVNEAIYGRTYSSSSNKVEASLPVVFNNIENTKVRIKVLDDNRDYISGISFNIYDGNCSKTSCSNSNLIHSFTTTNTYTSLNDVLSPGVYTIVKRNSNTRYTIPEKTVITVYDSNEVQEYTIDTTGSNNNNNNNNNYYNEYTIKNDLNDSNNYIKIYNINGSLVNSFKSSNTNYSINLTNGNYYIIDSKGTLNKLYFKIENGYLYVKYDNSYIRSNSITLNKNNDYNEVIEDNKNNNSDYDDSCVCRNNKCDKVCNVYYDENGNVLDINDIEITNDVNVDVKVDWLSNVIDCPITDLSSTLKYILGAIILGSGTYLVYRNVKKSKNNI